MKHAKWGIISFFAGVLIFILPFLALMFFIAGGGGEPVPVPATEAKAFEYQYACSELGAPWDIVMLADVIRAYSEKEGEIEDYNPIITGLEFCKLKEEKYILVTHENDDGTSDSEWELDGVKYYEAADAILAYAGQDKETLSYRDASQFIVLLQNTAEKKSSSNVKYEVTLENYLETEYEVILEQYIGLEEADMKGVVELYEARYLPQLYGYDEFIPTGPVWSGNTGEMPDIVVGDVTRQELLEVAASIMDWPYLLGGKSARPGAPTGALDCSGYVDWVYYQCFGKTIAGGGGSIAQFYNTDPISEGELLPGDLVFLHDPKDVPAGRYNHVGIYIGEIGGQKAWIHCGGSGYKYDARPNGRVGISVYSGSNDINPILGGKFSPPMNGCKFKYYRRARVQFAGEGEEDDEDAS
ncbi:MAG: C40 family peptidase [Lachnospiraceae bacterium]|nr:C40 family peptidase [Lachnospiraceae bacterium]